MKARDRYVVGQLYRYEDLTEQEKSDAALTMDNGVAAREMMYRFTMLTSKDIRNRFDYDLDKEWGDRPEIQRLMMDIATNGVENAAVDREGNRRMIACAILNMDCPWFEVVDTKKGLNEAIADIPKPASPLPKLEVCDLGDDRFNIIAAGSHERISALVDKAKWIMEMVDPEDAEEDAETMLEWARHIVWAANNALKLYEALEVIANGEIVLPGGDPVSIASAALKAARGEK